MSREETDASPFAALFAWERNTYAGGGGSVKVQVPGAGGSSSKLRGGRQGERRFNAGQKLAGTKINNIVKVKYVKNNHDARRHIIQHVDYIQKRERDKDEPERKFYGRDGERSRDDVIESVLQNRGKDAAMFKIILSPKQNELAQIAYAKEIMERFEDKSGIKTDWSMVEHKNTQYHHVHIVMPGKDVNGHSYRLEREHLDMLKEIANEYQYELQLMNYQREMDIQREFGFTRDEATLMYEAQKDFRDMKDLGVRRPDIDRLVREEILPPAEFDDVYFAQQLQKEVWKNVSEDFRQLESEIAQRMQQDHPELYPGFVKELQTNEINNAYFSMLKDFHPAEYHRYMHDPTLDRTPVLNRLKQAFPEWFDPIVEELKEANPQLFVNYKKPDPTQRQLLENLQASNPELFPELSKQIQKNQVNSMVLAMLAVRDPEMLEQILNEQDFEKQKELFEKAQSDFPDFEQFAKDHLAEKYPKLYEHGKKEGPTNTDIIRELVVEKPELFPGAAKELQKVAVDNVLFEKLKEKSPELAQQIESDSEKLKIALEFIRMVSPEDVEKATEQAKEANPALFKVEDKEPSQVEIMRALQNTHPELFPNVMWALKDQEVDKAYFERGRKEMPDGLLKYVEDPSLDRTEIVNLLKTAHPDWMPEIEREIKETMPQVGRYFSEKSDEEIIRSLLKTNPELFPGLKQAKELDQDEEIADRPGERLERLLAAKERLVDKAYFERGRELLSDGLSVYLDNMAIDRAKMTEVLQKAYPEWRLEIESELAKIHPELFAQLDAELGLKNTERVERELALDKEIDENTKPQDLDKESKLLVSIVHLQPKDKTDKEQDIDKVGEQEDEKDDQEKQEEAEQAEDQAKDALYDAQNIKSGHEWDGLIAGMNSAFIDEPLDLKAEADSLFDSQQQIAHDMKEFGIDVVQLAPEMLKLQDMMEDVKGALDDLEKDSDERSDL